MISPSGHPTLLILPTSLQLHIGPDPWGAGLGRKGSGDVKDRVMAKSSTGNQRHRAQTHPCCTGSAACRASAALEAAR